jgi:hypothetical protein
VFRATPGSKFLLELPAFFPGPVVDLSARQNAGGNFVFFF